MRFTAIFLWLGLSGCVTGSLGQPELVQADAAPVSDARFAETPVKRHADFFISGRPGKDAFKAAAASGVSLIINLQEKNEIRGDDSVWARQAGVPYVNIPVSNRGSFQKEAFEQISANVANAKGPVWVYCASGNRAGAWYAVHLMLKQGMDQDDALGTARSVGMTRPEFQDRVLDYVNSQMRRP